MSALDISQIETFVSWLPLCPTDYPDISLIACDPTSQTDVVFFRVCPGSQSTETPESAPAQGWRPAHSYHIHPSSVPYMAAEVPPEHDSVILVNQ